LPNSSRRNPLGSLGWVIMRRKSGGWDAIASTSAKCELGRDKKGVSKTTLTYKRKARTNNNALQVSVLSNTSSVRPKVDAEKLIVAWVERSGGKVVEVSSPKSGLSQMASATFPERDFAYQAWFWTDGADTIQATFICDAPPGADELAGVPEVVSSMHLGEAAPSKKRAQVKPETESHTRSHRDEISSR
jgi:hypothetical protein